MIHWSSVKIRPRPSISHRVFRQNTVHMTVLMYNDGYWQMTSWLTVWSDKGKPVYRPRSEVWIIAHSLQLDDNVAETVEFRLCSCPLRGHRRNHGWWVAGNLRRGGYRFPSFPLQFLPHFPLLLHPCQAVLPILFATPLFMSLLNPARRSVGSAVSSSHCPAEKWRRLTKVGTKVGGNQLHSVPMHDLQSWGTRPASPSGGCAYTVCMDTGRDSWTASVACSNAECVEWEGMSVETITSDALNVCAIRESEWCAVGCDRCRPARCWLCRGRCRHYV